MTDSPLRPIRVVSVDDPALDLAAMGYEGVGEYAAKRDPALLRFLPGMESSAHWYTLGPISNRMFHRFVQDGATQERRWVNAFLCSIRKMEGYVDSETGERRQQEWRPSSRTKIKQLNVEVWPDDVLDVVPPFVAEELGKVAYDRCALSGGDVDFLGLPPGLLDRIWPRISRAVTQARASLRRATSDAGSSSGSTDATAQESQTQDPGRSP